MIFLLLAGFASAWSAVRLVSAEDVAKVETIALIRHGEKPPSGLGNLDIQGLNRALALPALLLARYGRPAFIFAPDPAADPVNEGSMTIDGTSPSAAFYVRPLLTIGPTAILCGLPINTAYGFRHIAPLEAELDTPPYRNALILIAWEHRVAGQFIRDELRAHAGNPDAVPLWPHNDFDSIYIVRITRTPISTSSTFTLDHENLNNMSTDFPQPPKPK